MVNVSEQTAPQASGNGNGLPPFLLTAAVDGNDDEEGRYDFVFIDGKFTTIKR